MALVRPKLNSTPCRQCSLPCSRSYRPIMQVSVHRRQIPKSHMMSHCHRDSSAAREDGGIVHRRQVAITPKSIHAWRPQQIEDPPILDGANCDTTSTQNQGDRDFPGHIRKSVGRDIRLTSSCPVTHVTLGLQTTPTSGTHVNIVGRQGHKLCNYMLIAAVSALWSCDRQARQSTWRAAP